MSVCVCVCVRVCVCVCVCVWQVLLGGRIVTVQLQLQPERRSAHIHVSRRVTNSSVLFELNSTLT